MAKLISFDIDGTLEVGDPPGKVTMDMVRGFKELGFIIGSCSDRPISYQIRLWDQHSIDADFTVLKQSLDDVKTRFSAEEYYHVGDSEMDRYFADRSGFRFVPADDAASQLPRPELL